MIKLFRSISVGIAVIAFVSCGDGGPSGADQSQVIGPVLENARVKLAEAKEKLPEIRTTIDKAVAAAKAFAEELGKGNLDPNKKFDQTVTSYDAVTTTALGKLEQSMTAANNLTTKCEAMLKRNNRNALLQSQCKPLMDNLGANIDKLRGAFSSTLNSFSGFVAAITGIAENEKDPSKATEAINASPVWAKLNADATALVAATQALDNAIQSANKFTQAK